MGSVHMGTGVCFLEPDGAIQPHLPRLKRAFTFWTAPSRLRSGGKPHTLGPGHFGLIPTGVRHSWRNPRRGTVRWLEMQAPQPRAAEYGRDTFFNQRSGRWESAGRTGHFDESQLPRPGGPSQMEGFNPTTGVAIKMFVDRSFGAIHQSLFLIQYQPGAKIDPHDHTFEESYLIVGGSVRAIADGASTIWVRAT